MKLISCYIENFGGLSEYSIDFDDKLTVIKEANGFGKTTLAAFIKAMFYGFPKGARTLEKNERKLYTPWQGGSFGGNLSFEHEGIKYRIERFFGSTPKQDSFALYELDPFKESERFSEKIGLELFQLDVDSYEKSTYMAQFGDAYSFATTGIQTKLGDLVEEADDIYNFDKAIAALKEKRSKYKAYRGNGGSIYEINSKISKLQNLLAQKPAVCEEYEGLKQKLDELVLKLNENEKELETIRRKITEASERVVLLNLKRQFDALKVEKNKINLELEKILCCYKKGLPSKEKTEEVQVALENISNINTTLDALKISKRDQYIYESNKERFSKGLPTDDEFAKLQDLTNEYITQNAKLLELENQSYDNSLEKNNRSLSLFFVITGAIAIIAGIILVAIKMMIPGIVLGLIGLVIEAAGVILLNKYIKKEKNAAKNSNEYQLLKDNSDSLSGQISQFLKLYYDNKKIEPDKYTKYIAELRNECNLFRNAQLLIKDFEKASLKYKKEKDEQLKLIEDYADYYGFSKAPASSSDIRKISEDIIRGEELFSNLKNKEGQIEAFCSEHGEKLNGFENEDDIDLNHLKTQEATIVRENNALNSDILKTKQKIEEKNKELEEFPKLEDELERWCMKFEEDKKACDILDETMDFLQKAKDNLTYNYVNPIKERFESYVNRILEKDQFKVFIDKELDVRPEKFGEARELTYFSAGYTDIVRLCMHFALVDVLFKDTACFIILDDPFVNLDDEKTKEAINLLKKLSESRQIVYLVCNSSRV